MAKITMSNEAPVAEIEVARRRVDHLMKRVRVSGKSSTRAFVVAKLAAIKQRLHQSKAELEALAEYLPAAEAAGVSGGVSKTT